MADPLARARAIHESYQHPDPRRLAFEHNTYAALLDVAEAAYLAFEALPDGTKVKWELGQALATLEARIKEETDE